METSLLISLIFNVIQAPLTIIAFILGIQQISDRRKDKRAEQIKIVFVNLKGKASATDNSGIITRNIKFTFNYKNKSTSEEAIVKIINAQLKVTAADDNEYDFIAYDKTGKVADFNKRPLELPKVQPRKSGNNHITFKYRNLPMNLKKARVKIDFIFVNNNDEEVEDATDWKKVDLI